MSKVIPVLGSKGFVKDLLVMVDEAMTNFYLSQRSQSDSWRGNITSLSDLIRLHGNDARDLKTHAQLALDSYFGRQFVYVDLKIDVIDNQTSLDLQIDAILGNGVDQVNVAHVIMSKDSVIKSIIDLQNNGAEVIPADLLR